jgi:hypothetical protein
MHRRPNANELVRHDTSAMAPVLAVCERVAEQA